VRFWGAPELVCVHPSATASMLGSHVSGSARLEFDEEVGQTPTPTPTRYLAMSVSTISACRWEIT
jgi:ATP-dependent helicase YprA (DUF1998 family)